MNNLSWNQRLLRRISLPCKVIIATLFITICMGVIIDKIYTRQVREIFDAELHENLRYEVVEYRLLLNKHIKKFSYITQLIVSLKEFSDAMKEVHWSDEDQVVIKTHTRPPQWFPKASYLQSLAIPVYTLLIDMNGNVREVYRTGPKPLPRPLLSPDQIVIDKSFGQSFITNLDSSYYIVSTSLYEGFQRDQQAWLMAVSPLDDRFLADAVGAYMGEHLTLALITSEEIPRIVTSTNNTWIQEGATLESLNGKYISAVERFFDFGLPETLISVASFIPVVQAEKTVDTIVSIGRFKAIIAIGIYSLVFVLITFWISRRIHSLTQNVVDFSRHSLGLEPREVGHGDQLEILRERFEELSAEVFQIGDIIKKDVREHADIIVDSVIDAIVTINAEGTVSNWNPGATSIFGWSKDEVIGKKLSDIIFPAQFLKAKDSENIHQLLYEKSLQAGEVLELKGLHRDGHEFPIELSITRAKSNGSSLFIMMARDITTRKRLEAKIREAKELWEESFDAISDAITIHDNDFNIIRANRATQELFGISFQQIIGQKCFQLFHGMDRPPESCPSKKAVTGGQAVQGERYEPHLRKHLSIKVFPRHDKNGQLAGLTHVFRDITAQKRAEEEWASLKTQIFQGQKMEALGNLAGGIAHDFNNILSAVIGYSELALLDINDTDRLHVDLSEVLKGANRAKELVHQILTFSRRSERQLKPLRIQLITKEVLKLLRSTIPATIEIESNIEIGCPTVLADPTQIHQVIMNLCTNAYHAMREEGGTLGVALLPVTLTKKDIGQQSNLEPGEYVKLLISDTGPGMTEGVLEKIFDPYFTTKPHGEGTGLGLAVVHGIITGLGGGIEVYSKQGEGTIFHIYLPVANETEDTVLKASDVPLPYGDERILIVDDDEAIVNMNKQVLENHGYTVTAQTSSVKTLQVFQQMPESFDLVISDMTMPRMTGAELLQQIRSIRPDVPVILCTGFSDIMNEEKAKSIGIRYFIMKPIVSHEIVRAVRKALDEKVVSKEKETSQ